AFGRLMAGERTPTPVIEPTGGNFRGRAGCRHVAAVPELDHGRAIPRPTDVQAHPKRVLNHTPEAVAEWRFGPSVRPGPPIEVHETGASRELAAGDLTR